MIDDISNASVKENFFILMLQHHHLIAIDCCPSAPNSILSVHLTKCYKICKKNNFLMDYINTSKHQREVSSYSG